jgi:hypothetical protein
MLLAKGFAAVDPALPLRAGRKRPAGAIRTLGSSVAWAELGNFAMRDTVASIEARTSAAALGLRLAR